MINEVRQDEARGQKHHVDENDRMKYICTHCGEGYYSAAPLTHLRDPYCENCRGELAYTDEYLDTPVEVRGGHGVER